jgi:hypothetical protein
MVIPAGAAGGEIEQDNGVADAANVGGTYCQNLRKMAKLVPMPAMRLA